MRCSVVLTDETSGKVLGSTARRNQYLGHCRVRRVVCCASEPCFRPAVGHNENSGRAFMRPSMGRTRRCPRPRSPARCASLPPYRASERWQRSGSRPRASAGRSPAGRPPRPSVLPVQARAPLLAPPFAGAVLEAHHHVHLRGARHMTIRDVASPHMPAEAHCEGANAGLLARTGPFVRVGIAGGAESPLQVTLHEGPGAAAQAAGGPAIAADPQDFGERVLA